MAYSRDLYAHVTGKMRDERRTVMTGMRKSGIFIPDFLVVRI